MKFYLAVWRKSLGRSYSVLRDLKRDAQGRIEGSDGPDLVRNSKLEGSFIEKVHRVI